MADLFRINLNLDNVSFTAPRKTRQMLYTVCFTMFYGVLRVFYGCFTMLKTYTAEMFCIVLRFTPPLRGVKRKTKLRERLANMANWTCERCRFDDLRPGRIIMTSGATHIRMWCGVCRAPADIPGHPFVSKAEFTAAEIAEMPVLHDFNVESGRTCEYEGCTNTDVELHHWGPRHLFQDYGHWPTSWLCRSVHHPLWHCVTKTGQYRVRE